MASIQISRDSGYADRLRKYAIVLDGQKVGELSDGETSRIPVSPGPHELAVRIDWCGSKPLRFTVGENETATFRVESNLRGGRILAGIWYVAFARDSYLKLVQLDGVITPLPNARGART